MKLSIATSFALAAPILAAYTSADIPTCANTCFEGGAPKVGCSVTDQACLCENSSDLTDEITSCVTTSCSISDALKTQQVSNGICEDLSSSSSSASVTAAATSTGSVSVFITLLSSSSTATKTDTNSGASASDTSSSAETVAVTLTGTLVSSGTNTATVIPVVFNTTSVPINGTMTSITTPVTPAANSTASSTSTRTTSADSSTSSDSDTSSASATSTGDSASASSTAGASTFNEHGGFMASFVMMVAGVMMF
ncbi:hypothetical protein IWZ03DRAFT_28980 [Phyllosticta citriasiana]|uniref:CFEM domain-containing protein n=1 Tax=Phyllosticta citriasiana TaxID=595635 RepID=A0ABR1L0K8_9PEZI